MAEAILFNLAGAIITKLGSLARTEIGLVLGVKDELEKLKDTISTIQAVLLDAGEQYEKRQQVKVWVDRLKDIVYDTYDLLDDLSTETVKQDMVSGNKMARQVRIFFSSSNHLAFGLKMGHKIKAVRKKLDAIAKDSRDFGFIIRPVETRDEIKDREQTHSFVREEEVFGREEDKKSIIQLLLNSHLEESVSIISILGIGGLGKTTLAQLVINDDVVEKNFDLTMWVCVSDDFNVKLIVEKIIESATKKKPESLEMNTLQELLRKKIDGKKYLLVLDDVWNDDREEWLRLKTLLMGGAIGSRILVTTRLEMVAKITSPISPYILKGLSEKESWSLFAQLAFERGQEPENPMIIGIGKEIVKKCVGVPLAIRTIGSLMYLKKESVWQSFKNSELSKISQKENDILPTLRLSYDHLQSHLKHCFAYCRLFLKDARINVQQMIHIWVAQGFINASSQSKCLEDVGYEYFLELLSRSFFQEAEEDEYGTIIYCKMHDLMHDLAIQVAGIESNTLNSATENIDEKTRHISFCSESSFQFSNNLLKAKKLRTIFTEDKEGWVNSNWNAIISNFCSLRVLNLVSCNISMVPTSIRKLKHLRYLNLSWNAIIMLPSSITKLQNLETLILSDCFRLKELPGGMDKMVGLKHLYIDGCENLTHTPCGLGELKSLQTLTCLMLGKDDRMYKLSGGLNVLNKLNNLKGKLSISNLDCAKYCATEFMLANLKEKQHLQSLELFWETKDGEGLVDSEMALEYLQPHPNLKKLKVQGYSGPRFPSWISSVTTHLVSIKICNCFKFQYLPSLDQLPSLKNLYLRNLDALEYVSNDNFPHFSSSTSLFPSLQHLEIWGCANLKGWWRSEVGTSTTTTTSSMLLPFFPLLCSLQIVHCPRLTSMPLFPSVESWLTLRGTSGKPLEQTMMMATTTSPLSKLKVMEIDGVEDLEYPLEEWLLNLSSLKELVIGGCSRLAGTISFGMQYLSSLEKLSISNCEKNRLSNDDDDNDDIQWKALRRLSWLRIRNLPKMKSLPEGLKHVSTLKTFELSECPNLITLPEWLGSLTLLKELEISKCPNLISIPWIGSFSSLQWLHICDLPQLKFPEGLQSVSTLKWLRISCCPNLEAFSEWLGSLTALERLYISNFHNFPAGIRCISTLQRLEISNGPSLMTLPEWLGSLTSLQELCISDFPNLESLPKGLQHLTTLQTLSISECHNLASLPPAMCFPTSLLYLRIYSCPLLRERCQKESGEDWPKISHIPSIEIVYY